VAEQVRIDLVADDKASKTIDHVADAVEDLEHADPAVTISADDNASTALADVADAAAELGKTDPTVTIGVDDNASGTIADVRADAAELAARDTEIVLQARVDAAKADLAALRSELEQTGDKAQETARQLDKVDSGGGSNLRGNAIADLTGPLGDASDGISDNAEGGATKVGISASAMTSAITGIGVGVAAAAALWTLYKQRQEEARQKQEQLNKAQRDFNKAVREGKLDEAAQVLLDQYGELYDKAKLAGVGAQEFTRFLTAQSDELPTLNARIAELNTLIERNADKGKQATAGLAEIRDGLLEQRDAFKETRAANIDANKALDAQDDQLHAVASTLGTTKRKSEEFATSQERVEESTRRVNSELDRMKGALNVDQAMNDFKRAVIDGMAEVGESALDQSDDVLALKQSVIDMGEQFGRTPLEIKTELDAVDAGDLAKVARDVEAWYRLHPIMLASKLDRPGQINVGGSGGGGVGPTMAAPSSVINVNMPAGSRGVDVLRQVSGQARRSGRRYGAQVVHYARR